MIELGVNAGVVVALSVALVLVRRFARLDRAGQLPDPGGAVADEQRGQAGQRGRPIHVQGRGVLGRSRGAGGGLAERAGLRTGQRGGRRGQVVERGADRAGQRARAGRGGVTDDPDQLERGVGHQHDLRGPAVGGLHRRAVRPAPRR
jgi:hypothetical protein